MYRIINNLDRELLLNSFSMSEMAGKFMQHQVAKGCSGCQEQKEMEQMDVPSEEMPC